MKIRRLSKCVYEINQIKVDIRKWKGWNFNPIRIAFIEAMLILNPKIVQEKGKQKAIQFFDGRYCYWCSKNNNMRLVETLEWQIIV